MIDICMALDQSVSPHTGVRTIQNTGVFWQAVFQPPRPYSLFLEHGSTAKTLISHPHNTASYAGNISGNQIVITFQTKENLKPKRTSLKMKRKITRKINSLIKSRQ